MHKDDAQNHSVVAINWREVVRFWSVCDFTMASVKSKVIIDCTKAADWLRYEVIVQVVKSMWRWADIDMKRRSGECPCDTACDMVHCYPLICFCLWLLRLYVYYLRLVTSSVVTIVITVTTPPIGHDMSFCVCYVLVYVVSISVYSYYIL